MHKDPNIIISELESEILKLNKAKRALTEEKRVAQRLMEDMYAKLDDKQNPEFKKGPFPFDGLTFIIAYYNIPRQIVRTLTSCSPKYQKAADRNIEVIIADNGSTEPLPDDIQEQFPFVSKVIRTDGKPSPVFALNAAIKEAKYNTIGLIIDGAHIISPGVFRSAREICQMFQRPVINIPQYSLGNISQNLNPILTDPFDREAWRLNHLGWPKKGYSLFHYAVFSSENTTRSILDSIESNCLISKRDVFESHGAFDERFDEAGAGFANLEMFSRLVNHPDNKYVVFPGEGTFHQDHGGTTTRQSPEERDRLVEIFREKYTEITGLETLVNITPPMLYGTFRKSCQKVPTISKEYGKAKDKILKALANIYVHRTQAGMIDDGYEPTLVNGLITDEIQARPPLKPLGLLEPTAKKAGVETNDLSYYEFLLKVHRLKQPKLYFEIGIDRGISLSFSKCRSIGVDPAFAITQVIPNNTRLFKEKSDTFFEREKRLSHLFKDPIDLAFIDGMHLAEYVVRDFYNTEKFCAKNSIILLDDVLPEQLEMTERARWRSTWTGDVYKIIPVLRKYRPDLEIGVFESFVGPYRKGLAVVKNLDPANTILKEHYEEIRTEILGQTYHLESITDLDDMSDIMPYSEFETFVST